MNNANTNPSTGLQSGSVRINNAGLVLLNGFFPPLFERLCLRADQKFVNSTAQRRAVHFLQYLVSGQSETAEHHLHLNKLLCGLAPHEPLKAGIAITDQEAELCQGLLAPVIQHWSAIGSSSIEGLRGNWMIRDGTLTEVKDHWDLIVERRAYDVLLARSPFSCSMIKHPWMEKAIYVTWPT